jgi:hypothetical protein
MPRHMNLTGPLLISLLTAGSANAQLPVKFVQHPAERKVDVLIGDKPFTSYIYTTDIEKPVLYPLETASGITVTRGFPLKPRANERTDHPHHTGLWFNYGDVNGLDFWNNSYAIPAADKPKYGSVHHQQVVKAQDGKNKGELTVTADWVDHKGTVLLKEKCTYTFSGDAHHRVITRVSTLTAQQQKVDFKDNKEGVLGIRVCRELEMPSDKPEIFTDANGVATTVAKLNNEGVTGNYLTSEGKKGNDAWGTRGNWCLDYGTKEGSPVSIAIIDHPANPGYPTYWHARGYGLFAANTLGQEALSGGKEKLNFSLEPGKSVTFRYRIIITDQSTPTSEELNKEAGKFSTSK